MARKIVVSSNCQTGGLAATLKAIFPEDLVLAVPLPAVWNEAATQALVGTLEAADCWVTGGRVKLATNDRTTIVKVPNLHFDAFHPDIVYAKVGEDGPLTIPHYNSAIGLWAYNNALGVGDASRLFNASVFRALGYFSRWATATEHLKHLFGEHGLDAGEFALFINKLKRGGVFMHTVNHPHIQTIVELGKIVSRKLGAPADIMPREIAVPDGLTDSVWPVYPEVGSELGLKGDYYWRVRGTDLVGVPAYLAHIFGRYAEQGAKPGDLKPIGLPANFGNILAKELDRS